MSERLQIQKCSNSTTCPTISSQSKLLNEDQSPLMLRPPLVQAKLAISQPEDEYEQEADRITEQVMRMPDPIIQQKSAKYHKYGKDVLQAKKSPGQVPVTQDQDVPPIFNEVLHSPGQPLDQTTQAYMERRLGHDFSQVRVYNDAEAAKSAETVNAQAYTLGNKIVFGQRKYTPESWEGLHLLAHELTHVVQQRTYSSPVIQRQVFPTSTNYRFDTYRVSEQDLSDPDVVARFKSLPLNQLIKYRGRVSDYAVIDFIDQLINEHLNAQTLDQLFEYLAIEKDQVVRNYIDQWLATHAPTSFELAAGKNKPGLTETSMKVNSIDVKVLPDEFADEPTFKGLLDKVSHGQVSESTKGVTIYDPKWHPRWIIKSGKVSSVKPTKQELKIKTVFLLGTSRIGPSGYGVGTRPEDVRTGRTTLAHHEGSHATCFIQYLRDTVPPTFTGKIGDTDTQIKKKAADLSTAMKRYYDNMASLCGTSVDCTGKKAPFCP